MEQTEKLSFNHGKGHVRDFAKARLSLRDKRKRKGDFFFQH